jgi:hypothetical protein
MNNRFNNSKMSLLKNKRPAKNFKPLFLHLFKLIRRQQRSKTPSKEQYAQLLKRSNTSLKLSQPSKAKDSKLKEFSKLQLMVKKAKISTKKQMVYLPQ